MTDLLDNTFYAVIEIKTERDEIISIDARPSDALALAVRFQAEIFADLRVLQKTQQGEAAAPSMKQQQMDETTPEEKSGWQDALADLSADALGKYKH